MSSLICHKVIKGAVIDNFFLNIEKIKEHPRFKEIDIEKVKSASSIREYEK